MSITFKIADGITPKLQLIAKEMSAPRSLAAGLGKELEIQLRAHFMVRDKEPNKMGWPSKHFWKKEVRANTALSEVSDSRAVVTIASPAFVNKVLGGPIKPKRGDWLTIPKTAEAYKAGSASLFPRKLHRNKKRDGDKLRLTKALYDKNGVMQYVLAKEAKQEPDPRAWPDQAKLEASLLDRAKKMLARLTGATPA